MRRALVSLALAVVLCAVALAAQQVPPPMTGAVRGGGPPQPPLLQDYLAFTVTAPPPELTLDPFYKKCVNAQGLPVVACFVTLRSMCAVIC